jgi:hypothetical protein
MRTLLFLLIGAMHVAAGDFELSVGSPFQWGVEENGVTTITPLIIMPCKGATQSQHPGEGDIYLILKNVSAHAITISMRDDVPVSLTFFTPCGEVAGKKWQPLTYSIPVLLPKNPGFIPFVFTLQPGEFHIYALNLFHIRALVNNPLDWMAVYSTNKIKITCTLRYVDNEEIPHDIHSSWIPVTVQEPVPDRNEDIPEGSTVEATPSSHPGEPPQFRVHTP